MNKLPFLILAGSPMERDALMQAADVDYKVSIDIHGKPMLNYILEAIHGSNLASYILIVGPPEDIVTLPEGMEKSKIEFMHMEGSLADKFYQASQHLLSINQETPIFEGEDYHFIFISGDIPALTSEMIIDYNNLTGDNQYDFYYPVVEESVMDEKFPNNQRSYMKLERKKYAGGDMSKLDAKALETKYDKIKLVTENRKSFVKGLFFASPLILIKYMLGFVKMKDVERLMTKILELKCKLIISEFPEIAFDVDKPHQLDMIRDYLS